MNRRLLRTIGIAIIIFPDPTFITDVVGLLLVAASYLLFRKKKLTYKQLNRSVLYHLSYTKGGEFRNRQAVNHTLSFNPAYGRTSPPSNPGRVWQQSAATGQILHHTLDRRPLTAYCKTVGHFDSEKQRYCWHGEYDTEKTVHHMLNRNISINRNKEARPLSV